MSNEHFLNYWLLLYSFFDLCWWTFSFYQDFHLYLCLTILASTQNDVTQHYIWNRSQLLRHYAELLDRHMVAVSSCAIRTLVHTSGLVSYKSFKLPVNFGGKHPNLVSTQPLIEEGQIMWKHCKSMSKLSNTSTLYIDLSV